LENANGITYSVSNSTVIAANPTSLFQSPIPKYLWHDVFAFCRASTPAYYTTTDNVNWTAATLDKRVFAQKEAVKISIINPTGVTGSRWVWSSGIRYTMSRWMVLGLAYQATQAHITIVIEKSSDGSTWTVLHSSSFRPEINAAPIWISIPSQLSTDANYLRLTITKDPQDTTGATSITSIKLLTSRWGDQGLGSEYEYPYDWDADGNIFIKTGNVGIGTTSPSYKLDVNGSANATTLYENGSRVITSGNIASQSVNYASSAGSVAWTNVSGRPTNVSSFTNDSGYITSSGSCASAAGLNYKPVVKSSDALDAAHWANQLNAYLFTDFDTSILSSNGIIIDGGWDNTNFGFQILIDDDPTYIMGLRQRNGGGWSDWKRIPMGDGTGASGTWGISISGNAATATKLQTARLFTIGNTGKYFDGTANVSWTLTEIGVQPDKYLWSEGVASP